jgi:hypothetical protein
MSLKDPKERKEYDKKYHQKIRIKETKLLNFGHKIIEKGITKILINHITEIEKK